MCTSIAFTNPALYGRNLDLDTSFGEELVIMPRNFDFPFHCQPSSIDHYALVGMAHVEKGIPLFADAMNEKGLYMAGLNFPGNAYYFPNLMPRPHGVAPYELIPLVLRTSSTLEQARNLLLAISITAIPFAPDYPLAPLHWHIAGPTGSITVEQMEDGLHIYDNPIGVLTNNPPFPYQMMNLSNYRTLSPFQPENSFAPQLSLQLYGEGMGAIGLPGDASPMSRFVRAAFFRAHAVFTGDNAQNVMQFFHILDAEAVVCGSVITPKGRYERTIYASCMDAAHLVYYYKTYESSRICSLRLTQDACRGSKLCSYPLEGMSKFHDVTERGEEQ